MPSKTAPFALLTLNMQTISRHRAATLADARRVAVKEAVTRKDAITLVWLGSSPSKAQYVDPSGHVSTLYHHDDRLGCVELWTSRETGTPMGLYHGVQARMEQDPDALWVVVCEKHNTLVGHRTLTDARRTRSPMDFCDGCRHGEDVDL